MLPFRSWSIFSALFLLEFYFFIKKPINGYDYWFLLTNGMVCNAYCMKAEPPMRPQKLIGTNFHGITWRQIKCKLNMFEKSIMTTGKWCTVVKEGWENQNNDSRTRWYWSNNEIDFSLCFKNSCVNLYPEFFVAYLICYVLCPYAKCPWSMLW